MRIDLPPVPSRDSICVSQPVAQKARSGRSRFATVAVAVLSLLLAAQGMAALPAAKGEAKSRKTSPAQTLPASASASISAAVGHDQIAYYAASGPRGVHVQNVANSLSVEFTSSGLDLRHGPNRFVMALRKSGRGERLHSVKSASPRASANRVEYRRGDLTEWYANGPLGLEQGFTLARASGSPEDGPLTLSFGLAGGLSAAVDPGARGLTLAREGVAVLHYAGLVAVDAKGTDLPAWLEQSENELRLRVDDAGATYPVTIDPVLGAVKLTNNVTRCFLGGPCETGNAGDRFGFSVAVSDDGATVAVAAPHATGSNVDSGAVYVFRRPTPFGWNGCITIGCLDYAAKITTNPGGTQHGFGAGVAISGDGNTVAVLHDTLGTPDSSPGIVWVYQKPATGWASTGQQAAILSLHVLEVPCQNSGNPSDCASDFSSSIDINGDGSTVVLGYTGAVVGGLSRGAVYVFVRPSTGWVNNAFPVKLTRSPGGHLDLLGMVVSISADDSTIAAAVPQANGVLGGVDVFEKNLFTGWQNGTQAGELTYAPGNGLLFLGNGVDINADGSTVVAGGNGRALIFSRPVTQNCFPSGICVFFSFWTNRNESAQLSALDGSPIARPRISADGTRVVAAGFESPGMLYAFLKPVTGWVSATEGGRFGAPDGAPGDLLGYSSIPGSPAFAMSRDASVLLAGAAGATIGTKANQGAAYIFLPEPVGALSLFVGSALLTGLHSRRRAARG